MTDPNMDMAVRIARLVAREGGTAYAIGGCVRDKVRHKESKDIDIEVHGVYPQQLEEILDALGERISIGESFGIYNLKGYTLDIAMPRKEENRGAGHKDFEICVDPFIGTYKAAIRRDFTMNALMEDILTGEIVDHFGGVRDIENGVIRHIRDDTFAEDPLRVLRAAQFAARFGFSVAQETVGVCRRMRLDSLPKERVMGELTKAMLKAEKPSVFFQTLRQMDQLSVWFAQAQQTIGVRQNPKYHAEGDVWTHTMLVVDAAVRYRDRVRNPLGFMLAALTHDFGKAVCTQTVRDEVHAYGHERYGLPEIEAFLGRLTTEKALTEYVLNLVENHMAPGMLAADRASVKATNKMFDRSVDPEALLYLAASDKAGRETQQDDPDEAFLSERLAVYREYMRRPYVMGRDLIAAGIEPSGRFSEYLAFAHKLRLAGVDKESALRQTLALAAQKGDHPSYENGQNA